jgi:flagellar hook protein FlgE
VSILLIPDGSGTGFDVMLTDQSDAMSTSTPGTLFFAADGTFDLASTDPVLTLGDGTAITIGLATSTMYGGPKSLAVTSSDGASAGSLQQFQIAADGSVLGVFSNGQKLALARIALANFNNPMGLEKIGNTVFQTTSNSRLPQVGTPMSGGRGQLLGATLEMSNVDLAQEFTNLIIAQRGFQANSRVITTSDQMLQDLVDIKR